jgi:hypothetical protein
MVAAPTDAIGASKVMNASKHAVKTREMLEFGGIEVGEVDM